MTIRPARLSELGERLRAEVRGDGSKTIVGLAALDVAGPEELSFLLHPRYRARAAASQAGALLVSKEEADRPEFAERALLVVEDPELARLELLSTLYPSRPGHAGVHPTASVAASAQVDPSAALGPYAVVGEGSVVGADAVLCAHVVVGRDCRVGAAVVLHPHVVLYDGTELGARTVIHAGSVLGADGFGYLSRSGRHLKVPQVGRVVVEEDVEVGALSTIDRATLGETRIGAGTKIDNQVQVGHNVQVGRGCILCGQAGIAGSSRLGDYVVLAGQAGVGGHLEVGRGV
ncbi:MAG TPA: UDP-3-O-(3-hydroxymyristoyl)glucosamine N-acyltransferase, partial [Thermoanaerobaculia bacterium]|nr:UDP-3-O-(3-hydroxymyristoyl)glucosamine N-acyltransferase [Thermoanaerobaculia bacterium]